MKAISLLIAASLLPFAATRATEKPHPNTTISLVEPLHLDVQAKPTKLISPWIHLTSADDCGGAFRAVAVVQCIVGVTGAPRAVACVQTSDAAFGRAVMAALGHTRFSPAIKGGKAVAIQMRARVSCFIPPRRAVVPRRAVYFGGYFGVDEGQQEFLRETANYPAFSHSGPFVQLRGAGSFP